MSDIVEVVIERTLVVEVLIAGPQGIPGVGTVASVNGQTGAVVLDLDDIGDGATSKAFTSTEKTKLATISSGATVNSPDATLLARGNHTGTQLAATISDFSTAADARIAAAIGATVQGYDANTVKKNVVNGYSKQQYAVQATLTDAASIAWNLDDGQSAIVTLGGNRTLANPTNLKAGATYALIVRQDATGGRTLAYGSVYKWPGGVAPTLSTGVNAIDIITFVSDGTNMYGVASKGFA